MLSEKFERVFSNAEQKQRLWIWVSGLTMNKGGSFLAGENGLEG